MSLILQDQLTLSTKTKEQVEKNTEDIAKNTQEIEELEHKIAGVYRFKGTVEKYSDLPSTDNVTGDVWDVQENGMNYAWTDEGTWDQLGPTVDLSGYVQKTTEINGHDLSSNITLTPADIGAQPTIDSAHKVLSDLIDDTNQTHLFVSENEKSTWSGKQDALVSGDNIKTINGTSVLGSGDINITTNYSFDESWTTDSTITAFLADVYADAKAIPGMTYIGELTCSDLPTGLNNAEAVVEVMPSATAAEKALHVVITSGNLDPYRWELTYWVIGSTPHSSGWIAFQPKLTAGTGIDITNNTISTDALRNIATGNNSLSVLGNIATSDQSTNIGFSSKAAVNSVAYGYGANSGTGGTAIGRSANASGLAAVAVGYNPSASAGGAIMLGNGLNNEANTLKVALTSSSTRATTESAGLFTLMNANGTIPVGRYIAMTGADGTNAGVTGAVPAPTATDNTKFLKGDGTWAKVDAFPSQAGNAGKVLSTNGVAVEWVTLVNSTYDPATKTITLA